MASHSNSTTDLTVPGRPLNPCNGAAQHYKRPGDPSRQITRRFLNGTTITFGTNDIIPVIRIGEPFFEQVQSIQGAEENIRAIRQEFKKIGCLPRADLGGDSSATSLVRLGDFASINFSLQDFSTDPSLGPPFHRIGTSRLPPESSLIAFSVPKVRDDDYFPDPNYYGPSFRMSVWQQDKILSANGIKIPATYRPDKRYYHGLLHHFTPPVAHDIVAYVDCKNQKPPLLSRSYFVNTMLAPYGLPPHVHMPALSLEERHAKECLRHYELMKEVLAVPGHPGHGEPDMIWYRILESPQIRSQAPVWHPSVIDLYGKEEQYEHLLMRDINHRNNNEKGVGRPGNRLGQSSAVQKTVIQQRAGNRVIQEHQKTPAITHDRTESETSIFFKDTRTPSSNKDTTLEYLGYSLKSNRYEGPDPEISPTKTSRGRTARSSKGRLPSSTRRSQSASRHDTLRIPTADTPKRPLSSIDKSSTGNTPLLDFDERYSEEHGEGEDVDFALRDLGPPRIQGKTFNQAIGFTPSPEKGTGSSAPFGYPMNVMRYRRD